MREVARLEGRHGELVLREADDGHHEVISNGVFLMDTRDGRSERGLVREALAALPSARTDVHVLLGGLGVGFSLGAALADPCVARVVVVELEPAVVTLVADRTGARTGAVLDDPRVEVRLGDVAEVLAATPPATFDLVCLDVDNGPDWTVGPGNDALYLPDGIDRAAATLTEGGVLAVWSAHDSPDFAALLAELVGPVRTLRWPVPRGEPDVVWIAGGDPTAV